MPSGQCAPGKQVTERWQASLLALIGGLMAGWLIAAPALAETRSALAHVKTVLGNVTLATAASTKLNGKLTDGRTDAWPLIPEQRSSGLDRTASSVEILWRLVTLGEAVATEVPAGGQ